MAEQQPAPAVPSVEVIIPARGGSKRLPRKNILEFRGKPMLGWTIECARRTGLFSKIWVSTEDREIGEIAERFGAVWLPRPDELGTDTATVSQVCLDFLERLEHRPEVLVCLYPAVPLRQPQDIVETLRLVEAGADTAMTVTDFWYDPCEALRMSENQHLEFMWEELAETRRQQRPKLVVDAGSVYCLRTSTYLQTRNFCHGIIRGHPIPRLRAIDMDDPEDWELLNLLQ